MLSNLPPGVSNADIEAQIGLPTLNELVTEMQNEMDRLVRENDKLTAILTADATLAGAVKEIKQLSRELQSARERIVGLMEEKNAAIAERDRLRKAKA